MSKLRFYHKVNIEEKNSISFFCYLVMYIPFGKDVAIHLNIFNSASPKDASCLVWLKLAWWFWRKRFLNFVNAFLLFCYHLPLEKRCGPSFEQSWIPLNQGCFVTSLVEIGPMVLKKDMKMWKSLQSDNRYTDAQ